MVRFTNVVFLLFFSALMFGCKETPTSVINEEKLPPTVTITFPINGSEVHETVTIRASVASETVVDSVIILINGTRAGDASKYSGEYQYNWETASLEDSTDHTILVKAIDISGKTGQSELITVTVDNKGFSPSSVVLEKPDIDGAYISLKWSPSNDIDFNRYELFRSVKAEKLFEVIFTQSSSQQVVFKDSVIQSTGYEYYVRVVDNAGLFSGSNHRIVEYSEFIPPIPENFYGEIKGGLIDLYWEPVNISDFGEYVLYKKTANLALTDSIKITEMNVSSFSDSVSQYNNYEYKLVVFDDFGNNSSTNSFLFSSAEFQPQIPILYEPIIEGSNVYISWSLNNDLDFEYYEIYRSKNSSQMELIQQIDIQNDTTFTDVVTQDGSYDYFIAIKDIAGLTANSNLVSIPPEVFFPKPVQLLSVSVTVDTVSLNWTQNINIDFSFYRIEQSTDGSNFTGVLNIDDQTMTATKFNVVQFHDYSYRISCG